MEFSEVLKFRQSVRSFKDEQITEAQLQAILNAAYAAPVGMGWFDHVCLIVVQEKEAMAGIRAELLKTAPPQATTDATNGAATLIYVCEKADDPEAMQFSNTGAIMETMLLAAANEGLGAFYMMGGVMANLGNETVKKLIQLPEGYLPRAALAVGVPAAEVQPREIVPNKINTFKIQ